MKKLTEKIIETQNMYPGDDLILSGKSLQRISRDYFNLKKVINIFNNFEKRLTWAGISRTSHALEKYLETGLREDPNDGYNWHWHIQGEAGFFRFTGECGYGSSSIVSVIGNQISIDIETCGGHWIQVDIDLDLQAISFDNTEKLISVKTDKKISFSSWGDSEEENYENKRVDDIKKLVISALE